MHAHNARPCIEEGKERTRGGLLFGDRVEPVDAAASLPALIGQAAGEDGAAGRLMIEVARVILGVSAKAGGAEHMHTR